MPLIAYHCVSIELHYTKLGGGGIGTHASKETRA